MTGQVPSLPGQRGRNPITHQAHRRDVFRQITLPLLFGGLLLLAAAVMVVLLGTRGQGDVSRWADVSLIWLIAPMMVFVLLFLALVAGLAYAVTRLMGAIPPAARRLQDILILIQDRLTKIADSAVEPVLATRQANASRRALWSSIRRLFSRRGRP